MRLDLAGAIVFRRSFHRLGIFLSGGPKNAPAISLGCLILVPGRPMLRMGLRSAGLSSSLLIALIAVAYAQMGVRSTAKLAEWGM